MPDGWPDPGRPNFARRKGLGLVLATELDRLTWRPESLMSVNGGTLPDPASAGGGVLLAPAARAGPGRGDVRGLSGVAVAGCPSRRDARRLPF